jgi:hypothetical protein
VAAAAAAAVTTACGAQQRQAHTLRTVAFDGQGASWPGGTPSRRQLAGERAQPCLDVSHFFPLGRATSAGDGIFFGSKVPVGAKRVGVCVCVGRRVCVGICCGRECCLVCSPSGSTDAGPCRPPALLTPQVWQWRWWWRRWCCCCCNCCCCCCYLLVLLLVCCWSFAVAPGLLLVCAAAWGYVGGALPSRCAG